MARTRLTKRTVDRAILPETGQTFVWDTDLPGFGLRLTPRARSYIVQDRIRGKTRRLTIGSHGKMTPDEARARAREALAAMHDNIDPEAARRAEDQANISLQEVAERYLTSRRTRGGQSLKDSTRADVARHVASTFADWRERPIASITREDVIQRYHERCNKPLPGRTRSTPSVSQANQAMRVLGALIKYAAATCRAPDGRPIILDNPTRVLQDANLQQSVKPRTSVVPLDKLGCWWAAVQDRRADPAMTTASRSAIDLVAFLALTGVRLSEGRTLQWEHVDLNDACFQLLDPKNRRAVTLPLSKPALQLLEARPQNGPWVFPSRQGDGHISDCRSQLEAIDADTGIRATPHDLRRTFIQIGLKACGLELWRVKALSNHKLNQDVTLNAYADLSDVRFLRPEADLIAEHIEQQASIHRAGNVAKLERAG